MSDPDHGKAPIRRKPCARGQRTSYQQGTAAAVRKISEKVSEQSELIMLNAVITVTMSTLVRSLNLNLMLESYLYCVRFP
jgi:hypothetical protein